MALDCEWKPGLSMYEELKPAILQIGGLKKVFIVDLLALDHSEKLNQILT